MRIREVRDCPVCAAYMRERKSVFGTGRDHEQVREMPDGKWKHVTLAGRKWHKIIIEIGGQK